MVVTATGERLKGSAAKKYKNGLAVARDEKPVVKKDREAESKAKIGCRIRMLRPAKEWNAGDVYEVQGASSGCWKVVGKNGTHHHAVNKADNGKIWTWSEFQSCLTDVRDVAGGDVYNIASTSSSSAGQSQSSIVLSGFWRSEFNQAFHYSPLCAHGKPIYVTEDNSFFLYLGTDRVWRICPMEGLSQAQSSGDCGHASATSIEVLGGEWHELVDMSTQRWATAHVINVEPPRDGGAEAGEEPLAKRSRVVPLCDPELDTRDAHPLSIKNAARRSEIYSKIINRLPKTQAKRQLFSRISQAHPKHQDEILSFVFKGMPIDINGRLISSRLTPQDVSMIWSRFEDAIMSLNDRDR